MAATGHPAGAAGGDGGDGGTGGAQDAARAIKRGRVASGGGPLGLAISPCPNDTFAFHALIHGLVPGAPRVDVTHADIDVLNARAAAGEDDVVKVSFAAVPWLLGPYRLLPAGGALGRGCGPLILTAGRAELRGATVAVPGMRTTAYLLFRLWAADVGLGGGGGGGAGTGSAGTGNAGDSATGADTDTDIKVEVVPFEKIMPGVRDGRYDAGLVIHESRFTYPTYGLTAIADLGDWWEGDTGLPIPLGAVVARSTLDTDALAAVVRSSVAAAFADPDASSAYVLAHAQEMSRQVVDAHIALYVNDFTLDLGDEGYAAVSALLGRAAAAGLVPPLATPLR